MSRSRRLLQRVLYGLGKHAVWWIFRLGWRLRVKGATHVPRSGGVILAANHLSLVDPPIIGSSVIRPIHFLAKEELFHVPLLGWFIRQTNAFPLKRMEHDVSAFKHAQRLLERGEAVLVFPEGTRQRSGRLGCAKPGAGMLAVKVHVPIVPVLIHNSNRLRSFARVSVTFGEPIPPPLHASREDYQRLSDLVMARPHALRASLLTTVQGSRKTLGGQCKNSLK
ncbi:MAG: 1-acyl-sn-glycerol-3-phosphate acyltransferase [Elusimicrobia bacterium]|nr:1-acyl-sn-glycerol-3-phosphate acyltransferase [Elusimicrobiota bacterium]